VVIQPKFPEVELPTEVRKKEPRSRMAAIEQSMLQDPRFHSFVWTLKYQEPGPRRYRAIERFWHKVYEEKPPEGLNLTLRGFAMNDFLEAGDELCRWEHPMRPPPDTSSWGHPWSRRSSVVTDGPLSLGSSKVGTKSVPGSGLTRLCVVRGHPLNT
jgi:hypothetical protein